MKSQVRETTAVPSIFLLPVTPPPHPPKKMNYDGFAVLRETQQREDEKTRPKEGSE